MRRKKTSVPAPNDEYVYDNNLSVDVKDRGKNDNAELHHYYGSLLREQKLIDGKHKYCSLCLTSHVIKILSEFN